MSENNHKTEINISTMTILKIVLIGVLVFAVFKLRNLILVILTAIVIASFVEYAVFRLKHFIKNRTLAVFIIYIITIAIIVGLSSAFVPVFMEEMSSLVDQLGKYIPDDSILNTFQTDTITGAKNVVGKISGNASIGEVINSVQKFMKTMSGGFFEIFGRAFGGIFNLFLILIISFYLSITERGIESFLRIITPSKYEEYIINLWQRTERKIGLWLQGQMLLGLIIGLLAFLGLTILGVKYSLVLSLITAICLLVPFGIFVALIISSVFAYIGGGITMGLMTAALFFILHQFENYLIAPLIVKKVIGIPSLVVILAVLIGAELAGVWGVILAVPCAVLLFEFFDDLEKKKVLNRLN
jgi:predicted PurR-regulated permease PerM